MDPRDLFISHSSGDAEAARELRAELEAAGYSCWMAPDDVDGTDPWAEQILAAIEACSAMLVLISSNANRSPHVSREVNLALGRRRPVLPIRIEDVPPEASLEYLLSLVQRIDAFPPPITAHAPRILRRLDSVLRRGGKGISDPVVATAPPSPTEPVAEPPAAESDLPTEPIPAPVVSAMPGALGPGVRVGAFEIEAILGEGGMATIYRARQQEPRRAVALKVIRADHAADPVYRTRFLGEKDTLASLEHPSIVPIYAAGEANGVLYIAMRLVDGPDLASRIESRGRLSLTETIATLKPIADAVDYAHEKGVVHRDLKPSNIILDSKDRPYLTDFGLGKHLDKSQGLSAPGIALGTLAYMAPEQFSGLTEPELSGRIDIYALACVAYTCLTGAPPFDGATPERMMYAHLHEQLPERADLPDSVEVVLRRALAKAPKDRYATAAEFMQALTAAAGTTVMPTAQVPVRKARGGVGLGAFPRVGSVGMAAMVLVLLIAVSGGIVLLDPAGLFGDVAAITDAPSMSATSGPTDQPTPSPGPTPTPEPPSQPPTAPPPTPTDQPGPTPDLLGPTGIGLSIKGDDVKTKKLVDLSLTASGATEMRLGRASSQTGTCTYENWRQFRQLVSDFDLKGGPDAGVRWVCAEFRDSAHNPAGPIRDHVTFDNPPVINYDFYWNAYCDGSQEDMDILEGQAPYAATDRDGLATLRLTKAWVISGGSTVDLTTGISANGRTLSVNFYAGQTSWTVYYIVRDSYVERQGHYKVYCPPW